MKKYRKDLMRALATAGVPVLGFTRTGSGHQAMLISTPAGLQRKVFLPTTTSDHRSMKNVVTKAKKVYQGARACR